MDMGGLPWWTVEGLKISFWRPFSSLTHYRDYLLCMARLVWADARPKSALVCSRGKDHLVTLGHTVHLTGLTIQVTAVTEDGRPAEATFRFTVPLEDGSLRWVAWQEGSFAPFNLPGVGEKIVLPGADLGILL